MGGDDVIIRAWNSYLDDYPDEFPVKYYLAGLATGKKKTGFFGGEKECLMVYLVTNASDACFGDNATVALLGMAAHKRVFVRYAGWRTFCEEDSEEVIKGFSFRLQKRSADWQQPSPSEPRFIPKPSFIATLPSQHFDAEALAFASISKAMKHFGYVSSLDGFSDVPALPQAR